MFAFPVRGRKLTFLLVLFTLVLIMGVDQVGATNSAVPAHAPDVVTLAFDVQFSTDGVTFSDNVSVSQGDTVWVRLAYDHTGDTQATSAQTSLTLPAGFTLVNSSTRTCLTPSGAETVCNDDAGMGGAITEGTVWTGSALAMGPQNGLYGQPVGAATSIIEFGKLRYVNLHECRAEQGATDIFYTTLLDTGTNAANVADGTATCSGVYAGYTVTPNQILNLDLLGFQHLNLQDCQYINGADRIIVNTTNTDTSNTAAVAINCPATAGAHTLEGGGSESAFSALTLLGNQYLNLKECQLFASPDNVSSNVKSGADTNTAGSPDTANNCTAGAPYSVTGNTQLPLDLLDTARGAGFVEFQLDTTGATVSIHNLSADLTDQSGSSEFTTQSDNGDITVTAPAAGHSNILITGAATANVATSGANPVTYSPTADNAVINNSELVALLEAGTSVIINTTNGTGTQFGTITLAGNVAHAIASSDASLTLLAGEDIVQNSNVGVTVRGVGNITYTAVRQIFLNTGANVTAVNGDINMTANSGGATAGDFIGINIVQADMATTSGSGSITLDGTAGSGSAAAQNYGVYLNGGRLFTASGNLTIVGEAQASGATNAGVRLDANGATGAVVQATTGNVSITGIGAGASGPGVFGLNSPGTGAPAVATTDGDITIDGTGNNWRGVDLYNATSVQSSGTGNVTITGVSPTHDDVAFATATTIGSGSGNMTINADDMLIDGSTAIGGTGILTIQPRTAATTIGLGGGAGTLNLTDVELADLTDGFASITIGRSDAGNITIDTATFNDPLTLLTGNDIINANNGGTEIAAPSVTFDGNVTPSGTSVGTFGVSGNVVFAPNSSFEVDLNGATATGPHDQLNVTGSTTLNTAVGLTLDLSAYTTHQSGVITIIADTAGLTGTFDGLPQNAQTNNGGANNFLVGYTSSATLTAASPTAVTFSSSSTGASIAGTPVLLTFMLLITGTAMLWWRRQRA